MINMLRRRHLILWTALCTASVGCDALFPLPETESPTTESPAIESSGNEVESQPQPAAVGVGAKGNYGPGLISTPASAYWKTQEKIVFEIQIPKALQLYKALGDGAGPPSHEAFMSEIIQANRIPLPELPEGQIYQYDPATEQVMVVPSP